MQIQPAKLDQILSTDSGEMVAIDADAGGVAADLRRIDPDLKVYFAPRAIRPFWEVRCEPAGQDAYPVLTLQAFQSRTGSWPGLDQRVVRRIEEIDPRGRGRFNYAKELERSAAERQRKAKHEFAEKIGATAELAAFRTRKDLGERYRGRAFVPADLPPAAA